MFSKKNAGLFGLIAIIAWTVIEYLGLSFRSAAIVILVACALWLIVIWRELYSTPKS